jgi:chemotaxis receptor (MCP) glutamine deamidase CheD
MKPTLLENEAPTTKIPEMAHYGCSPMHKLIARLVQEGPQKNPLPNMASGIHHFRPISPRSPMLIKHRPSHLTKGTIIPLNHTILTSHIGRRKLMFETQITTKSFKMRVFKFTAIVATNSSNNISMSLVHQPQD